MLTDAFTPPVYAGPGAMSGTVYPLTIDAGLAALSFVATAWQPTVTNTDMIVHVGAGQYPTASAIIQVAAQAVPLGSAHASLDRIDRVVLDRVTGIASVVAGTPAANPAPPEAPAGKLLCCQMRVRAAATAVVNTDGVDERMPWLIGMRSLAFKDAVGLTDTTGISTGILLGRNSAGSGQAEQIAIGSGLTLSGGALSCTISPVDQTARDQIVLTNLRQMLNTSVGTGALVRGKEWELSTDEWGATSTGESYVNGTISYYTQQVGADVTYNSGSGTYTVPVGATAIQVKVWGGGGAARTSTSGFFGAGGGGGGFAMATIQVTPGQTFSYAVGAAGSGDGGDGGTSTFGSFTAAGGLGGGSDRPGFGKLGVGTGGAGATENGEDGHLDGSKDGTNLRRGGNAGGVAYGGGAGGGNSAGNPSGGYAGTAPGGGGGGGASGSAGGAGGAGRIVVAPVYAMTLAVPAAVTINSAPTYADLYFLWKDDSSTGLTAPSGTVRLSRDGGTTKAAATLTVQAAFDSAYSIIRARADVSGQPVDTRLWADIDFGTVKQRFAAPALLGV